MAKRRLLEHPGAVKQLLLEVGYPPDDENIDDLCMKIAIQEALVNSTFARGTLRHERTRHPRHASPKARGLLYVRILFELMAWPRPKKDDDVRLGRGGALPPSCPVNQKRKAFLVLGPPASGKSTISNRLADQHAAVILDSDYAKRKLPEYSDGILAPAVHTESVALIWGPETSKANSTKRTSAEVPTGLLDLVVTYGHNLVFPTTGSSTRTIRELRKRLREESYETHLVLVDLPPEKATLRAIHRFKKEQRYVPLAYVLDEVKDRPKRTFERIKSDPEWTSWAEYSTDVPRNMQPSLVDHSASFTPIEFEVTRSVVNGKTLEVDHKHEELEAKPSPGVVSSPDNS